jgi:hypothetical protein
MCIVIDPPVFISLFKTDDKEHEKFKPVLDWVINGPGKFVTGGSKYKEELGKISSILSILAELKKKGKMVSVDDLKVNSDVEQIKALEPSKDFDDPHLVALIRLTSCKLVCTRDFRSFRYLRSSKLYASLSLRPKIYTRKQNSTLLCPKNIARCCK